MLSSCHYNLKRGNFKLFFSKGRSQQNCSEVSAARAARLLVLTQPIQFLICGAFTVVPAVEAVAHFYHFFCFSSNEYLKFLRANKYPQEFVSAATKKVKFSNLLK